MDEVNNRKKILLIDDSRFARNTIKLALGESFDYLEAEDGLSGLELFFLEKPDLVVLDLTMPGMNGLDMLAQLKAVEPEARVIVCTADVQQYTQEEAMRRGAAHFVQKPIDPGILKQLVVFELERG